MTRGRSDSAGGAHQPALDVVAGLVPGTAATHVARAAVREAVARGARVRFVQVLEPGVSEAERDAHGASTFAAALKALRETSRVPVSFEIAVGEPGEVLAARSRSADLLVIGDDDGCSRSDVVRYCREHAECDVLCAAPATAGAPVGR